MATAIENVLEFGEWAADCIDAAIILFKRGQVREAESISRKVLQYRGLGFMEKARLHEMLSHGTHEFLFHAEQALNCYRCAERDGEPDQDRCDFIQACIATAECTFAAAQADCKILDSQWQEFVASLLSEHWRPEAIALRSAYDAGFSAANMGFRRDSAMPDQPGAVPISEKEEVMTVQSAGSLDYNVIGKFNTPDRDARGPLSAALISSHVHRSAFLSPPEENHASPPTLDIGAQMSQLELGRTGIHARTGWKSMNRQKISIRVRARGHRGSMLNSDG